MRVLPDQENVGGFFNIEVLTLFIPIFMFVVFIGGFIVCFFRKDFIGREVEFKVLFLFLYFRNISGLGGGWEVLASIPFSLLFLRLTLWFSIIFSWVLRDWRSLFSEIRPGREYKVIRVFLSFIELVSLVSRPIILRIRLTVNITVGMLFFNLLEEAEASRALFHILRWFEGFVAFIQALIYVFLVSNYSIEKIRGL